jgi:MFS family permease
MRTAARRYHALFVAPGVRPVFIASLIGRLPIGMATLLFVLVVHAGIGSYAIAGLAAAANSAATAAFGPPLGRLADRGHASIVLVTTGLAQGAAFVVLVIVLHAHVPAAVVVAVAAGIGAVNPPIAAVTRTVLPRLAPDEPTRRTAFALDALLVEITYVVGPATVGVVSAILDGYAATLLAAALTTGGALWLAAARPVRHGYVVERAPQHGAARWRRLIGPLGNGGLRIVLVVSALQAASFGVLEVAIPAYMNARGQAAVGGLLFSVWSAGSIVGGLWFGGHDFRTPLHRQYTILMSLNLVGFTGMLLANGPITLAVLLFAAGLVISPTTAVEGALVTDLAPRHQTTEAFTWSGTAIYLGFALGCGLASVVMSSSLGSGSALTMAITLAIGLCALGTVLAVAGRRALARRPYGGGETTAAYAH